MRDSRESKISTKRTRGYKHEFCIRRLQDHKGTQRQGKGISVYKINDATGEWELIQIAKDLENPSYLCFDNTKEFLYTVHGDQNAVSAYQVDKKTGCVTYLNTVKSGGRNPVYLTADKTNKYIYVASLQGGTVATLLRKPDGSLTDPVAKEYLEGLTEDGNSHAHQCILDRTRQYLFVPTQGRGTGYGGVFVYRTNEDGSLSRTQRWLSRKNDEPRHLAIHENNRYVYLANEQGNSVTFLEFDEQAGELSARQIVSTLPDTYVGESQAGAIAIHPNNRFIYTTNRTHNSVALLTADKKTGYLKYIACTPSLGEIPRFMTLSPDGKRLYAVNELSDTIRVFDIDQRTGTITFCGLTVLTQSPVCLVFRD